MKLIVGLGNPGEKYQNTRHNVGFMVVDELARKTLPLGKTKWRFDPKSNSQFVIRNSQFILAKPQTMMNASGYAVKKLWEWVMSCESSFKDGDFGNLWVIHDDLDLPLGKIKIVIGHGSAGHHGIDSIVEQLGTADFVRFRVGIGHSAGKPHFAEASRGTWEVGKGRLVSEKAKRHDVIDYVLEEFSGKEAVEADKMIKKASQAVKLALKKGLETAMNQYNK